MKRFISLVLSLLFCFSFIPSCFAATTDQFVFRDGITWGMTVTEVEQHEKNQNGEYLYSDESVYSALGYENIEVSSYPHANLVYMFKNGLLYGAIYDPSGANKETIAYLKNALHSKYGDSNIWGKTEIVKFFTYFYGMLFLVEEEDVFESLYIDAGVDNFDDFITVLATIPDSLSQEQEAELSTFGEAWKLPDGTSILFTEEEGFGSTLLLYFAPELDQFNTNGL